MNFKVLSLGAMLSLGIVATLGAACGSRPCSSATCNGCCDSKGMCVAAPGNSTNSTCGKGGAICANCSATAGSTCNPTTLTCNTVGGTGGTAGAGATGQGGAPGTGGATGIGGTGGNTCAGCLAGTTCITRSTSATSVSSCGIDGVMCQMCAAGQLCMNGTCMGVDAGGNNGGLGDSCTNAASCRNTPTSAAQPAFCRTGTFPFNPEVPYQDGMCTRFCLPPASATAVPDCGANGVCLIGFGPFGEPGNICAVRCSGPGAACRPGYRCIGTDEDANMNPIDFACLPNLADGGFAYASVIDAGAPARQPAGSACSNDTQCGPPISDGGSFVCLTNTLPDGGPAGRPGGFCTGDCSLSLTNSFCGTDSSCRLGFQQQPNVGPIVFGQCRADCNTDGGATQCRSGYACLAATFSRLGGYCVGRCDNPGAAACPMGTLCSASGLCQ